MSNIIVEPDMNANESSQPNPRRSLVEWVMGNVYPWRIHRDTVFKDRWDDYYKIWRGRYDPNSKQRRTERSRIIAPASQIAVDLAVAEIIEAIFAREQIFDIADDVSDQERADAIVLRDLLSEELLADGLVECLQEVVLNGALYGNFLAKIVQEICHESRAEVVEEEDDDGNVVTRMKKVEYEKIKIYPVPIEPGQLVEDPNSVSLDDGLGLAHEWTAPLSHVRKRQSTGMYYDDVIVGSYGGETSTDERKDEGNDRSKSESVMITEWHGMVPLKMLSGIRAEGDELAEAIVHAGKGGDEMVEALVTIANGNLLLRAIPNPSVMEDRAVVGEQFDTVPNRFRGRGIMEKGFNMQKALDGEMRARADALAWVNNPMLAGDITKLPPGGNLNAWPGKFWGTKGDPREAITELRFGDINASTFQQASELERLHQQATGAVDPSVLNAGTRDQATGASAINVSGIVKRSKRTMINLERFLTKLIQRIAWRKMQVNPEQYGTDYKFVVKGTVGVMAREVEAQNVLQALQFVDKGTPEYFGVLKLFFERSSMADKASVLQLLDQKMQPPSEEQIQKQQQQEQLQMQIQFEQLNNVKADTALKFAQAGKQEADAMFKRVETDLVDEEVTLKSVKAKVDVEQARNQTRQIEVTERKQQLEEAKFQRGDGAPEKK